MMVKLFAKQAPWNSGPTKVSPSAFTAVVQVSVDEILKSVSGNAKAINTSAQCGLDIFDI
jgi:hypothetical protein